MLSISEFKNKLVKLASNQEQRVADTQNGNAEKSNYVAPKEEDASVILLADGDAVSLEFDDAIKTVDSDKETITVYGNNKSVTGSDKAQQVVIVGENNKVDTKDGNDDILLLGNNNSANSGNGKNSVVFRGNNLTIQTGKNNDKIASLDFASDKSSVGENPDYSAFENFLKVTSKDVKGEVIGKKTEIKEISNEVTVSTGKATITSGILNNLTEDGRKVAQSVDFTQTVPGTQFPMYVIAQGSASGEKWHVYKYQSNSGGQAKYKAYGESVSSAGDMMLSIAVQDLQENGATLKGIQTTTVKVRSQEYEVDRLSDYTLHTSYGNKNIKINDAGGDNKILVNASKVNYDAGNGKNEVSVLDGLQVKENEKNYWASEDKWRKVGGEKENIVEFYSEDTTNIFSTAIRAYDPIILDFNRDGKISAIQGNGVDLNGDGVADGSASKGDKMLAMSDLNNSGRIDGDEVFGDQTVSPFSHQKLNAANGFEALAKVAQEAEQYTGISCINAEGDVDLANLKRALNSVGVNIGFISEDNVTELEDLAHVASINVAKYISVKGMNLQTGYYTDNTGKKYNANDVWFSGGNA